MTLINKFIREAREAAKGQDKPSKEKTAGALTRAISKKIVGDMVAKTKQEAKTKKRLSRAVNDAENPGDKNLPDAQASFDVWGATGLNGDGYAMEEQRLLYALSKDGHDDDSIAEVVNEAAFRLLKKGLPISEVTQTIYDQVSKTYSVSYYELGESVVEVDMDLEHWGVKLHEKHQEGCRS